MKIILLSLLFLVFCANSSFGQQKEYDRIKDLTRVSSGYLTLWEKHNAYELGILANYRHKGEIMPETCNDEYVFIYVSFIVNGRSTTSSEGKIYFLADNTKRLSADLSLVRKSADGRLGRIPLERRTLLGAVPCNEWKEISSSRRIEISTSNLADGIPSEFVLSSEQVNKFRDFTMYLPK